MTNHWIDIRNSDCILTMGSNPAENHPISGSPYKTVQVWKYRPVLLCKRLIFHHVLPEAIICN
jgi:predicted molibdopterin-dependent oxidoreductase YjgC